MWPVFQAASLCGVLFDQFLFTDRCSDSGIASPRYDASQAFRLGSMGVSFLVCQDELNGHPVELATILGMGHGPNEGPLLICGGTLKRNPLVDVDRGLPH